MSKSYTALQLEVQYLTGRLRLLRQLIQEQTAAVSRALDVAVNHYSPMAVTQYHREKNQLVEYQQWERQTLRERRVLKAKLPRHRRPEPLVAGRHNLDLPLNYTPCFPDHQDIISAS